MNLLHIDSSILGDHSASRILSAAVVARLATPGTVVTTRDLAANPLPHLSGGMLAAMRGQGADHAPGVVADVAEGAAVMQEFQAANVVVIGLGLYNFGVPSQLKAWVDRILVAGQTFRYGPDGRPQGLAGGKRVILAVARGGLYGPGAPAASFEHAETYMRAALGFIGVTDLEVIVAEGLAMGHDQRQAAMAGAQAGVAALAA